MLQKTKNYVMSVLTQSKCQMLPKTLLTNTPLVYSKFQAKALHHFYGKLIDLKINVLLYDPTSCTYHTYNWPTIIPQGLQLCLMLHAKLKQGKKQNIATRNHYFKLRKGPSKFRRLFLQILLNVLLNLVKFCNHF